MTLLVVAFFCLALGGVAGFLLASLRSENDEEPTAVPDAPPGGRKGKYVPVARLWREKGNQILIIEVDGKAYVAPEPLNPEQRERLERLAVDFARWTGASDTISRAKELFSTEPAVSMPGATMPAASMPAATTTAAISETGAPEPAQKFPDDGMTSLSSTPLPASEGPVVPAASRPMPARPRMVEPVLPVETVMKSVVQQIDDVVQEMAVNTPWEAYQIQLSEDPRRGVIVWVGASSYEGVDGVPNPEIRQFLHEAVAEWERRQDLAKLLRK